MAYNKSLVLINKCRAKTSREMDRELHEISNDKLCGTPTTPLRTAMAIFWQARPPQWRPHQQRAATFYSAKSRQGLGLGGLATRGGPAPEYEWYCPYHCTLQNFRFIEGSNSF